MQQIKNKIYVYKGFYEKRVYHSKHNFSVRYFDIPAGEAVDVLKKVKKESEGFDISIVYEPDRFHKCDNIEQLINYYQSQYDKLSKRKK